MRIYTDFHSEYQAKAINFTSNTIAREPNDNRNKKKHIPIIKKHIRKHM